MRPEKPDKDTIEMEKKSRENEIFPVMNGYQELAE